MSEEPALAAMMDANAAAIDLPIAAEYRAPVLAALAVLVQHGAALLAFELPQHTEPAPIYTS